MKTDIEPSQTPLESAWRSFGNTLAAAAGALTALISLLSDVPLAIACGRGALALIGVQLVAYLAAAALARTSDEPASAAPAKTTDEPDHEPTDREERSAA